MNYSMTQIKVRVAIRRFWGWLRREGLEWITSACILCLLISKTLLDTALWLIQLLLAVTIPALKAAWVLLCDIQRTLFF